MVPSSLFLPIAHADIPPPGLRISKHFGNFLEVATDLALGTLDADKAISVQYEHMRSLDERELAFLQSAVLYTTPEGQRRVRTCNLALQVASLAGSVFRFADMDTVVTHMIREGIALSFGPFLCRYSGQCRYLESTLAKDIVYTRTVDGEMFCHLAWLPQELRCECFSFTGP